MCSNFILGGVFILGLLFTSACENHPVNSYSGQCSEIPKVYSDLPGTLICGTETWENDTTITGPHFVLPGSRLTINAGVTVKFTYHQDIAANTGAIITLPADDKRFGHPYPSARLIAEGTEDQPIVFTFARPESTPGDWTGLLMLGRAFTGISNRGVGKIEGLQNITYGGDHNLDNSGSLEYVRIEYSGSDITGAGPSAGLSLYAAGRNTNLNHIQVYRSGSDGIALDWGKVALRNIIVYCALDNSFELKHGWQGRGQFWLAVQEAGAGFGLKSTGCNILADCPTNGRPAISNVILYGAGKSEKENTGIFLKKNMQGSYHNFIISNFSGYHWRLQGQNGGAGTSDDNDMTFENYGSRLKFNNFLLHNNGGWENASLTQHYKSSYTLISAEESIVLFNDVEHFDFSLPDASPYLTGGQFPGDSWFEQVEFRGALGPNEWPWARWPK